LSNIRYLLQSLMATIILFVTKNVRAQSARLTQQMPRWLMHTMTHTASTMTVMVACGVMVPASSLATTIHESPVFWAHPSPASLTMVAAMEPTELPLSTLVEQSKPIDVDMAEKQCSACDMNASKIASYLRASILPAALVVAPAATQVACAGTEHHTPPPQELEATDGPDPYDMMCANERRRGNDCVTKAEWYKNSGLCPNGTRDCQKK
jgi:hypothetical protein